MARRVNWTQQIANIQDKGYAAFQAGIPLDANPYMQGYRNQNGSGGQVQRQRRQAWSRGWELAKKHKEERE